MSINATTPHAQTPVQTALANINRLLKRLAEREPAPVRKERRWMNG